MPLGASLFLLAAGAILKYAITADISGIDIHVVGVILMLCGALGIVVSLAALALGDRPPPR